MGLLESPSKISNTLFCRKNTHLSRQTNFLFLPAFGTPSHRTLFFPLKNEDAFKLIMKSIECLHYSSMKCAAFAILSGQITDVYSSIVHPKRTSKPNVRTREILDLSFVEFTLQQSRLLKKRPLKSFMLHSPISRMTGVAPVVILICRKHGQRCLQHHHHKHQQDAQLQHPYLEHRKHGKLMVSIIIISTSRMLRISIIGH